MPPNMRDREYELVSTMQKSIRRGDENLACRCAYALLDSDCPPSFVFARLRVCVLEDVGPGDPAVMDCAFRLIDMAQDQRGKNRQGLVWKMCIANLCIMLARAEKWRIGNSLCARARHENIAEGDPAIPDWALDQHTRRGKAMGRGLDHFYEVGAFCENENTDDPHLDVAKEFWADKYAGRLPKTQHTIAPTKEDEKDLFSGN